VHSIHAASLNDDFPLYRSCIPLRIRLADIQDRDGLSASMATATLRAGRRRRACRYRQRAGVRRGC